MTNPSRAKSTTEKELDAAVANEIKDSIKIAMLENKVDMATVAERLTDMGRTITEQGLRNKISKSKHQTTWYFDLMKAIKQSTK